MLTIYLRLFSSYDQTPQAITAHDALRAQNKAIIFPKIYDIEERGDCIVYHARDFLLSRVSKALMSEVPFSLDRETLHVTGGSTLLDAERVAMSIDPPRRAYHYAAQFGLTFRKEVDRNYLLEIHCQVLSGTIAFGVLNEKEDDFLYRVAVSASP